MRWILAIFWCLLAWSLVRAEPAAVAAPGEQTPVWPGTVRGFGLTADAAREDAVRETIRLLRDYVRTLQPPLTEWQPSEEFVKKHLVDGRGSPGADVQIPDHPASKSWLLTVRRPDLTQLSRLDHEAVVARQQRQRLTLANERLLLAGQAFLLLFVAQMAVFCYHRLRR